MLLPLSQPFLPQRMDGWRQNERTDRQQRSGVMSVCTFLPQLAQTPVEQSQDKANEYGLDRLQYGWLEGRGGGEEEEKRDNKKSARKSTKTNMEDGAATERGASSCCLCGHTHHPPPTPTTTSTTSNRKRKSFLFVDVCPSAPGQRRLAAHQSAEPVLLASLVHPVETGSFASS